MVFYYKKEPFFGRDSNDSSPRKVISRMTEVGKWRGEGGGGGGTKRERERRGFFLLTKWLLLERREEDEKRKRERNKNR